MRLEFTLVARNGVRHDVVVIAESAVTVGTALARYVRPDEEVFDGRRRLDLAAPLASGQLRIGGVLTVRVPGEGSDWPLDGPLVAVVAGNAAGTLLPLKPGKHTVGRDMECDLVVDDPTMSARHAEFDVARDGQLTIRDLNSTNGTTVRGRPLGSKDSARVDPRERFLLGRAVCELRLPTSPDGSVELTDGEWRFNRVVHFSEASDTKRIAVPVEVEEERGSSWPQYVGGFAMLATGVGLSLYNGSWAYAVLGAIGPIVMLIVAFASGRSGKRAMKKRRAEVDRQVARAHQDMTEAAEAEDRALWADTLNPADAHLAALGPTKSLWSYDAADERALTLRVATQDREAAIDLGSDRSARPVLHGAPVSVNMRIYPVMGIAGEQEEAAGAARALVHQAALARSPEDLIIYYVAGDANASGWTWLRWLPHVRRGADGGHTIGANRAAARERLSELIALIEQRQGIDTFGRRDELVLPEVLVVMDGAGALRSNASAVRILKEGPAVGVRLVAIDRLAARLPAEATARLELRSGTATLELRDSGTLHGLTPDKVSAAVAERSARAVAALEPLGGNVEDASLPQVARFVDLVGLGQRWSPAEVRARWSAGREGEAIIGVGEGQTLVSLNLVEHGPHALVAGSTGSGKSEFLRTWLASMALSAPPSALNFFLIDFKGGGAFGKLRDLPHVVGYADDLTIGGPLANRLLVSLRAELDLRKARFKDAANASDLGEYRLRRRQQASLPDFARLVVVVDEFAELKEQQPDFVEGLVNVARIGRSLGVHLVLATQQPAGVVTPQIRDNANLRVCLRVLDAGTSLDLVRTPVAASFSRRNRGRAVVMLGQDEAPIVLQAAYVSGPPRRMGDAAVPPPRVFELPWSQVGAAALEPERAERQDVETDLVLLVDLVVQAAGGTDAVRPRRPWLQPLGDFLPLEQLQAVSDAVAVPFAVEDRPGEQRQVAIALRLGAGNVGIAGGRSSGRSTTLRTIAAACALGHTPDSLHLHVIDFSPAPALRSLSALPHCGTVATRSQPYVAQRLLVRLREELQDRSQLVARHASHSFADLRNALGVDAPPFIVVLVDGWDAIVAEASQGRDQVRDALLTLAEDGPPLGIQLVFAGGKAIGSTRLTTTMSHMLVLRFEQRDDLSDLGVPVKEVPDDLPPGRAFRPGASEAIQVAALGTDGGTEAQMAALAALAASQPLPLRHRPLRVEELPRQITLPDACVLPRRGPASGLVIGVGGDELRAEYVDPCRARAPFAVTGPAGSGRTETLAIIAAQAMAAGVSVAVRNVQSRDLDRFPGVTVIGDPSDLGEALLLVDDADRLDPYDDVLLAAAERTPPRLVVAGDDGGLVGLSGWKQAFRSGVDGLALSPDAYSGEALGVQFTREHAFHGPAGRAYLVETRQPRLLQVPKAHQN